MLLQIITATFTILLLDAIWLGFLAKHLYIDALAKLMTVIDGSIQANLPAAVVVYIALISGILIFVVPKANGSLSLALLWGAAFGFVTYATYDFTNLAVLTDWTLKISLIDTAWGMVLCSLTSVATVFISNKF